MPMYYPLGKLPTKIDTRTLKMNTFLKPEDELPSIPETYDIDVSMGCIIPLNDFGNKTWGDCVIAGRANLTQRFEFYEQKIVVPITTEDVLNQYWIEQGVLDPKCWLTKKLHLLPDRGLSMLESLDIWRKCGWQINKNEYNIYAFATLDAINEIKQSIYFLNGAYVGMQVSKSAMSQFNKGLLWEVPEIESPIIGGHAIAVIGYSPTDVTCITWGVKQKMTWDFFKKYTDEAYGVVDNKNSWSVNSILDVEKLTTQLNIITA